ncbi:hypothetical protein [Croceibacterium mercuriale]|uniref:hypothetical protein n=1 Tax=Croceibacterium mercuriale TaxID=1572751 RepID=UPI000A48540A|nr:hypothetical protein [Croceibacterium mercuriale]
MVATRLDAHLARSPEASGFDLIPFAALVGGDFLVLDYGAGAQAEPAVSVWHHQTSDAFAPDISPVPASFVGVLCAVP